MPHFYLFAFFTNLILFSKKNIFDCKKTCHTFSLNANRWNFFIDTFDKIVWQAFFLYRCYSLHVNSFVMTILLISIVFPFLVDFFDDKNWRKIRSNSSNAGSHLPYELTNIRIKIIKILAGALKAFPRKNIGQFLSRDLIKLPSAVFPKHECAMPPGPLRMSVTRPRGYNPLGVKSSSIQTISLTQISSAGWLHFFAA